jgi:hypothetical protein
VLLWSRGRRPRRPRSHEARHDDYAVPLLIVAGAGLGAPNPPLDAARLDIMPASLWGRAEGVRTMVRNTAQAGAPLLFGVIADTLGGGGALSAGASQQVSAAIATERSVARGTALARAPLSPSSPGSVLSRGRLGMTRERPGAASFASAARQRGSSARRCGVRLVVPPR